LGGVVKTFFASVLSEGAGWLEAWNYVYIHFMAVKYSFNSGYIRNPDHVTRNAEFCIVPRPKQRNPEISLNGMVSRKGDDVMTIRKTDRPEEIDEATSK
jgi:hypothetical protein